MLMELTRTEATQTVHPMRNAAQHMHVNQARQMKYGPAHYDCETAILLRAVILPIFNTATSWDALIDQLEDKGYHPMFREGVLCLTRQSDGARICGLRFLGLEMRDLVARLGRPCVLPCDSRQADGEIVRRARRGVSLN